MSVALAIQTVSRRLGSVASECFGDYRRSHMARIAIIGVGAIGGVVAALLELSGLVVETPDGPVTVRGANVVDSKAAPAVDWVLIATKAYDVDGAAQWLERLRAQGAPVAVLQNGVEHRERFAPYVPMESILPVVVDCPAERPSPERIRQRGVMHLKVPESEQGGAFVALFAGSPADAAALDDGIAERVLAAYRSSPADSINSMLADRLAGRPMEIDARNGVI